MKIKYFLFGAAALALGACSSDENENVAPSKGKGYVQFTVKLPSAAATRSETGADGTTTEGEEIGQDYENQIQTVQVILKSEDGEYANSIVINAKGKVPVGTDTYTTEPIEVKELESGTKYTAYVIVNGSYDASKTKPIEKAPNPTFANVDLTDAASDIAAIEKATDGTITGGKFLMTGKGEELAVITGDDETEYTKDYPLDCGTISVERAAARFDYKSAMTDDVYEVLKVTDGGAHDGENVTVTLTDIALTNVSKDFYLFKRVSADGTDTDWEIGGKEVSETTTGGVTTPANYVVDYNFANKTAANLKTTTFSAGTYFFNVYAGTTAATYTSLADLTKDDNTWKKDGSSTDVEGYKIWTYCTENALQKDASATEPNQINGLSTGVIFKGEIAGTLKEYDDDDDTTPIGTELAFNGTDAAYVLNGVVYGRWEAVLAAKKDEIADVVNAFAEGAAGVDESTTPATKLTLSETLADNTSDMLAAAGFTRYTPDSDGKYYTYYVYWNQHNDNGKSNKMGPMEFAVVRNNVYKLSVTEIGRLGHPNDPTSPGDGGEPDPDDPDPTNPDEDSNLYLKVSVKVAPWTVRKNGIKF